MVIKTYVDRIVKGIRGKVPSGYILGRTSGGDGPVELLKLSDITGAASGTAGGDLSGSYPAPKVVKLRGNAIKDQNPLGSGQNLYVLAWINANGDLELTPLTTILDGIGSTRGTILYRGASGWTALTPNTAGYVLTDGGIGSDPSWAAIATGNKAPGLDKIMDRWPLDLVNGGGGGGGGGTEYSWSWPGGGSPSDDSTANACKATIMMPQKNITVAALSAYFTGVASVNYRASIYALDASYSITGVVVDSSDATPGAVLSTVLFTFASPVTLTAGTRYAFAVRRTDANTSSVTTKGIVGGDTLAYPSFPGGYFGDTRFNLYARLAKATPIVGDTFTAAGGYQVIGIQFKI